MLVVVTVLTVAEADSPIAVVDDAVQLFVYLVLVIGKMR